MVRCAPNGALFMYIKNIFAESINNSCDDGDLTGEGEILTKLGIRTRDEWNSGARLEQAWQITQIGAGMANWSRRGRLPILRSAFGAGVAWQAWRGRRGKKPKVRDFYFTRSKNVNMRLTDRARGWAGSWREAASGVNRFPPAQDGIRSDP